MSSEFVFSNQSDGYRSSDAAGQLCREAENSRESRRK